MKLLRNRSCGPLRLLKMHVPFQPETSGYLFETTTPFTSCELATARTSLVEFDTECPSSDTSGGDRGKLHGGIICSFQGDSSTYRRPEETVNGKLHSRGLGYIRW